MALHPFLEAALKASVEQIQQAFPAGPDGQPLQLSDVLSFFEGLRADLDIAQQTTAQLTSVTQQQAGLINQQSVVIQQQQAVLTALPGAIATAIGSNNTQFVSPAIQSAVQALLGGALPTSLDTLSELVNQLLADESGAAAMLASINQLKTTVAGKVNTADLTTALAGKVDASTYAAGLASKVNTTDFANALGLKVNLTDYTTALAGKVNVADYTTALAGKASTSDLTTGLAAKVSTTDFTTALGNKVNTADFTPVASAFSNATTGLAATYTLASTAKSTADSSTSTANAAKASAEAATAGLSTTNSNVASLSGTVNNATSGLVATYTLAGAAKATADANTTGLATANTAIGNRLRKDQADTTTYALGVPASTGMDKAVQKSELVGGIQRPYRVFQNVGTTAVGAYVRTGQAAAVTDVLGLGQVYVITLFRVKTITAPTVASNITLYSNGTQAYTTTLALASVPAVNKTLNLLDLVGSSLPADITLPATLTVSASAGVFEILIDGVLK